MQARLDMMYDKTVETEVSLKDLRQKKEDVLQKHLTAQELYKILSGYDKLYAEMSDMEKKVLFGHFIGRIELDPNETDVMKCIEQVDFLFPVLKDGKESMSIRLHEENAVETVVLMSRVSNETRTD